MTTNRPQSDLVGWRIDYRHFQSRKPLEFLPLIKYPTLLNSVSILGRGIGESPSFIKIPHNIFTDGCQNIYETWDITARLVKNAHFPRWIPLFFFWERELPPCIWVPRIDTASWLWDLVLWPLSHSVVVFTPRLPTTIKTCNATESL